MPGERPFMPESGRTTVAVKFIDFGRVEPGCQCQYIPLAVWQFRGALNIPKTGRESPQGLPAYSF